jgi:hypothetical protein
MVHKTGGHYIQVNIIWNALRSEMKIKVTQDQIMFNKGSHWGYLKEVVTEDIQ